MFLSFQYLGNERQTQGARTNEIPSQTTWESSPSFVVMIKHILHTTRKITRLSYQRLQHPNHVHTWGSADGSSIITLPGKKCRSQRVHFPVVGRSKATFKKSPLCLDLRISEAIRFLIFVTNSPFPLLLPTESNPLWRLTLSSFFVPSTP